MNSRIKIILGTVIFIMLLIGADRLLKMQNRGTLSVPETGETIHSNSTTNNGESKVMEVTANNFSSEVLSEEKKVLIDFYATWCGPCKIVSPRIEELSLERDDVKFVKIDVDQAEDLASEYGIYYFPTLVVIKDGKEINRISGAISKAEINELLDK